MMGPRQVEQGVLFYNFSLDAHVPKDHLLRSIDRFVDLSELRRELGPFYSTLGRPSIDPELMIRMLIIGYASVSAPSGACAKRSTSIWPTGGSAGSGSTAMCPIIPPSRRTGMAVSARAICYDASLRRFSEGSFAAVDRPLCRPVGTAPRARAVHAGTAID